jgi:hypothetical protein
LEEKNLLGRFRGKAGNVAKLFMLMSTMAAAPNFVPSADAQERAPRASTEQIQDDVIDEEKITASGTWARDMVNTARAELGEVKTAEDAEWFVRSNISRFHSEFRRPTKGNLEKGQYGNNIRRYSEEDLELVLESAKNIKDILDDLREKRFGDDLYEDEEEALNGMIEQLTQRTSYAGRKQSELLRRAIENFK